MSSSTGALHGVKVIDLTRMLAGPFCTQMLADHGAEVIKVEPPMGDMTRQLGPFRSDDEVHDHGGYFSSINRNKRSIVLDLKQPAAREILLRLIEDADALVENFRNEVMDNWDLSYEKLRQRNPKLVYATVRGFGDSRSGASPYADWPAFDIVAQAMGGIMAITGPDAVTPTKIGPGVGDMIPGSMLAFGVVAALFHAERTGHGQFVDIAMVDGVLAVCERVVHQHSFAGTVPAPEGNRHPLVCPYGIVRAKDGWVAICARAPKEWQILCEVIQRPEWIENPRFTTLPARIENQDLVYETIEDFTRERTKQELGALLGGRIPFGPVYDISDITTDPHFTERGMLVDIDHPHTQKPVQIAGIPVHMSETPGRIQQRAPTLGEHTQEILTDLGYGAEQVNAWRKQEIIA